ncbi:MAG TPA: ABC transporter ATP-binding protein, partial [Jiangellaceae bacterium]|nr:ABC transporter ATP-binding protein [Jiangellaceae bacterium]
MSATVVRLPTAAAGPSVGGGTAVRSRGLTKRFPGGQLAVDGLNLTVPNGSVFGFLGPNGSGKTTTIRMLLGLVAPTEGTFELLGRPMPDAAPEVLPQVGALVEGPAFHPYLSGRDNLLRLDAADRTVGGSGARQRVAEALDRVGLAAAASKRYRAYSLGMRQRLGLAAALLRPRELLVLDEPTNGLDPQGTREVRSI